MFKLGETSLDGREILCRTEAGIQPRRVVRWLQTEPSSPFCAAQLAYVELRRGETIGWDRSGWPVVRRTRARRRKRTRSAGDAQPLSRLAAEILDHIASSPEPKDIETLVESADDRATLNGTPPVRLPDVDRELRLLRRAGYVERIRRSGSPAYRLTAEGRAAGRARA